MIFSPLFYTPQLEYHNQISEYWKMYWSLTRITPALMLLFSSTYSEFSILLPGSCSPVMVQAEQVTSCVQIDLWKCQ